MGWQAGTRQTKSTSASIYSEYDKAYGVIQGGCAKLVAYFLDILFMAVMHTLIHSAGADAYIGAKHQNTFEDNSVDKGKKKSSNTSPSLGALRNVCKSQMLVLIRMKVLMLYFSPE